MFGGGYSSGVTHRLAPIVNSPLSPQHLTMNVKNHVVGVRDDEVCIHDTALNLGNSRVCVGNDDVSLRDTITNVGNSSINV